MRLLPILFLVLCLASCTENSPKTYGGSTKKDAISKLYLEIINQDSSLASKMRAIEKGLALSQGIDSLKTKLLFSKASLFFELKEYDSLFKVRKTLEPIALKINDHLTLGKYFHLMGYYYENVSSSLDSAFYYHNKAKNSYLKTHDSTRTLERILRIAILQNISNDYFGAKETLIEALKFVNNTTRKNEIAEIYNELASNNRKLLNYKDAVLYYELAIETTDIENDIIGYKNNLAMTYADFKEFDKASKILEGLLADDLLKKNTPRHARILHNHSFVRWRKDETDPEIKHDLFKALDLRKKGNDKLGQISSFTNLGEYFLKTNVHLSKKYLDTAIRLSLHLKIPKAETDALALLMNLESKNIAFRDRYIFLKDSMYNNELKVKTQFAKMKYDDELEKAQILELEAETAQKRAELAEQKTQTILSLSLSGLLLLGGTSFLYLLRQRHKKEKLKEVYNTEKRISQDLHDGLANDVFGLMTKIQSQDKGDDTLLNHLEDIYQTTRQISHANSAIKNGAGFKDELDALIVNYQDKNTTVLVKGMSGIDWALLEEHKAVIVHRTVKELLVNMKKHSQANLASLQFEYQKKRIIIAYSDNGVGFNPKQSRGIGLLNTENRILAIGGDIIFEPKSGSGAKVIISVPF